VLLRELSPTDGGSHLGVYHKEIDDLLLELFELGRPLGKCNDLDWIFPPPLPINSSKVSSPVFLDAQMEGATEGGVHEFIQRFTSCTDPRTFPTFKDGEYVFYTTLRVKALHDHGVKHAGLMTPPGLTSDGLANRHLLETLVGIAHTISIFQVREPFFVDHHILGNCLVMRCSTRSPEYRALSHSGCIMEDEPFYTVRSVINGVTDLEWTVVKDQVSLVHEEATLVIQLRFETCIIVREVLEERDLDPRCTKWVYGGDGRAAKRM
jgi:hypothetical protein